MTDLVPNSDSLIIAFGGILQGVGVPRFEFQRITQAIGASLIFVRDPSQAWYQDELPGIGPGIDAITSAMTQIIGTVKAKRVLCIGNSMGGYAALIVGSQIRANTVLSFSPQTFISLPMRILHRDYRWSAQMRRARRAPSRSPATFDVRDCLSSPGYGAATVYCDPDHRLDSLHARRLNSIPRTEIVWRPGGHDLIRRMRDSGELATVLEQALAG